MINNELGTMLDFLEDNDMACAPAMDRIYVLNVKEEDYDMVNDKATSLGLVFHIHETIKTCFSGLFTGDIQFHHLKQGIDYSIEEYDETEHILGEIYHTFKIID